MKHLDPIISRLCKTLQYAAGALLLALMVLSGAGVVLRLAGHPVGGAYELSGFMGALLASFALAETQRRRGHVELDVLTRRYSEKTRRGVNLFNMSAGALVMAVVAMQLLCHAVRISRAGEVSETLRLPFGAIMVATACGFILLAVVYVADAFHRETGALQFPADGDQPGGKNNG